MACGLLLPRRLRVFHEGKAAAVGRPRGHVDRALASEQAVEVALLLSFGSHPPENDAQVRGMALRPGGVAEVDDPFAVRRGMREPVGALVRGELNPLAAAPRAPPHL